MNPMGLAVSSKSSSCIWTARIWKSERHCIKTLHSDSVFLVYRTRKSALQHLFFIMITIQMFKSQLLSVKYPVSSVKYAHNNFYYIEYMHQII